MRTQLTAFQTEPALPDHQDSSNWGWLPRGPLATWIWPSLTIPCNIETWWPHDLQNTSNLRSGTCRTTAWSLGATVLFFSYRIMGSGPREMTLLLRALVYQLWPWWLVPKPYWLGLRCYMPQVHCVTAQVLIQHWPPLNAGELHTEPMDGCM